MSFPSCDEGENFHPFLGANGRWITFTAAPIHDLQGNLIGAMETIYDITEHKQAEEELRKSKDQLEAIIQGVADGILALTPHGELIFANEAAIKTSGYPSLEKLLYDGTEGLL